MKELGENRRYFYSILTFVTAGTVSAAQPAVLAAPVGADSGDIVVTGHRQAGGDALTDVKSIAGNEPMARFETDICPRALGLPPDYANVIEARIREVARTVGVRIAEAGCDPNLTLIVAEDGGEAVASLRRTRPLLFAAMTNAEILRLRRSRGPVWNWYSVDPKRSDGGAIEHVTMLSFGDGPPRPASPQAYIASNVSMSRLASPVRLDITLAFIVLEKRALEGLTLAQVGDFSAMLGLSMINYGRVGDLTQPSILRLLEAPAAESVEALTAFDLAYLKGVYAGEPSLPFGRRSARIAASLAR
jgi:hypothetical protein